ncbi:DUF4245 domain-containing protein [Streptomyces smaragdinus]|uniref:DUF4245 domain-containing protein n=1 Tax=Streptomyces smaragdinus TaxID=2585196 RepID=UPI002B1ED6CF|nr:DUF4245 domain-containing protein [Streptomyces smaragdinus]
MSQNSARSRASRQTVRNLILSMLVTCAFALAVWLLFIPRDGDGDPVQVVPYAQEFKQAGRVAPYTVLAPPKGLPDGNRATSVRYTPDPQFGPHWHLGFVTSDEEYVGVEQAAKDTDRFVEKVTHEARKTDAVERIGGADWQRYEGGKYDALVKHDADGVTVVIGTGSAAQIKAVAAALEPAPR